MKHYGMLKVIVVKRNGTVIQGRWPHYGDSALVKTLVIGIQGHNNMKQP